MRIARSILLVFAALPAFAELKPETQAAFDRYTKAAEQRMAQQEKSGQFLALGQAKRLEVHTQEANDLKIEVPHGQIQHWIGAVFFPGVDIPRIKAVMQDYSNYARIYKPDVLRSRLISRNGDDFDVFLRLYKKQVLTVIFDSQYKIHYSQPAPGRMKIVSKATRITEMDDDNPDQPRDDRGFLWGLNSYWRFQEADGGVYVECEAISLSRDVPALLHAIVGTFLKKFPIESMRNTIEFTRREVASR